MEQNFQMRDSVRVDPDKLYTFKQAADLLGVKRTTVYQYVHTGKFPVLIITPNNKQVLGADIIDFLYKRENKRKQRKLKSQFKNKPDELVCRGCKYSVPGAGYGGHVCNYCFETGKKRGVAKEDCYKQVNTPYTPDLCL